MKTQRWRAAGVALMFGGAAVLMAGTPAQAAEVSYETECIPPPISGLPPIQGTTKVDIQAPETASVGDEIEIVWKTVEAASDNPDILDLGENTVKPTGKLTVSGAQESTLDMEGPRENPPIPKGDPMVLSDMTGTLTVESAGEITLTPGNYDINVNQPISTDTKCSPTEDVDAAATITVTEGGGDSGGTTGGDTGGDSGGDTGGDTEGTNGGDTGGDTGGDSGGDTGGDSGGDTGGGDTGGDSGGSTGGGGDPDGTEYEGEEVSVDYECETPIGDQSATSPVQINATKAGDNFDLTVAFNESVMDSPADIPADSVKPSMDVVVGGDDEGTVKVEGPTNEEPISSGDPIEIPDLKGTYTPGGSGTATLTPGVLTVEALGTTTTCTPANDPGPSLELDITDQGGVSGGDSGGASGGGDSGGDAGASGGKGTDSTGGNLAQTGASDSGALHALALLAGTVLLLGGAVFTFSPWQRLRALR